MPKLKLMTKVKIGRVKTQAIKKCYHDGCVKVRFVDVESYFCDDEEADRWQIGCCLEQDLRG